MEHGPDTSELRERIAEQKEEWREKNAEEVSVHGHAMERGDVLKFGGLVAFLVLMGVAAALGWPIIQEQYEEGGIELVISEVRDAGPLGALLLLGMQFLQIVVAVIPGEVVQIAAGMLYGPWLGALIILVGCVLSSAFVFVLVHKLGAPFVQNMIPAKYMDKFQAFEARGRLNIVVFVLFLIPGMPKDVFTYLVPLTDMRMRTFLVLSNVGRIPGVLVSTYAADSLMDGRFVESIVLFAAAALIVVLCLVFRDRIMAFVEKMTHRKQSK